MNDNAADRPQVELFTDGACVGNPGPGGWAYILRHPSGLEDWHADGEDRTTNNRMELTAVIRGLEALAQPSRVRIIGDSEYVLKGISEWMDSWKQRDWRRGRKGNAPVLNIELWQRIDELMQIHEVEVEWVRGHTGHPQNEQCDRMAQLEATRRQR